MDARLKQGRWLRIPGPTPLHPDVVTALGHEMIPHRGTVVADLMARIQSTAKKVHGLENGHVLFWAGTGTAGFEAAIVNLLAPGDKVVVTCAGVFGDRFANAADVWGLDTKRVEVEWGKAVTPEQLEQAITEHGDVKAVMITHNETSTGVTQPLADLTAVVHAHDALVIVDAVSSAAALPIEMEANGIDWVLSGAQKAWMCPPGLMISAISDKGIATAQANTGFRRMTFDLNEMLQASLQGMHPSTPPLSHLFAIDAALKAIESEGVENVFERHRQLGACFREGLDRIGVEILADPDYRSDSVTAFKAPGGSALAFRDKVREQSGIELAVGQGKLADVVNRVGTMGWTYVPELEATIEAIEAAMQ